MTGTFELNLLEWAEFLAGGDGDGKRFLWREEHVECRDGDNAGYIQGPYSGAVGPPQLVSS